MAKRKQMFGAVEVTGLTQPKKEKSTHPAAEQTPKAIAAKKEFAAASTAAKTLKDSLGPIYQLAADPAFFTTLQAEMRAVITKGEPSPSGPRSIDLSLHKESFAKLETSKKKRFCSIVRRRPQITVSPERNTISLEIPSIRPFEGLNVPSSATHFQFTLCIGIFSDMIYDEYLEAYRPKLPALHGIAEQTSSEFHPANRPVNVTIHHTLQACPDTELPADATIVLAISIQFFKSQNTFMSPLAQGRALYIEGLY